MGTCTEFAVFEVTKENLKQAIALSESLFKEINTDEQLIIEHQILQKTDNPEEICWHLIWRDLDAVKATTACWHNLPSAKGIEAIVGKKYYYGHFVEVVAQ